MELHGTNVVQVAHQREQAAAQLVIPDLDLVVITARHKQRLRGMKVDATNWTLMLLEF